MLLNLFGSKQQQPKEIKLCFETDLHSHILPGIDDGSPDIETSIELIKGMVSLGLKRLVATPHISQDVFQNDLEKIQKAYESALSEIKNQKIDVSLLFSAEYRIDDHFQSLVKLKKLIPLPSDHLLIENSFYQPNMYLRELIFDLQIMGYTPILAHPERYDYYLKEPETLKGLHETGCLFQINLLSISGYYGSAIQKQAYWLLDQGYIDFLGTDIHHMRHIEAIKNFITTKEYQKLVSKLNLKNDLI